MSGCHDNAKTEVEIMWTNQHGTGPKTDDRVETQIILQYMCQPFPEGKMTTSDVNTAFEFHTIRNGQRINTQSFSNGVRENHYIRRDYGLHEPANYYQAYYRRERQKGDSTIKRTWGRAWGSYTAGSGSGGGGGYIKGVFRDAHPKHGIQTLT